VRSTEILNQQNISLLLGLKVALTSGKAIVFKPLNLMIGTFICLCPFRAFFLTTIPQTYGGAAGYC